MAARPPNMDDWYSRQGLTVKGGGITLQAGGAIKGGQTAYATGTGFFLGYSGGAYKFSIGSSTKYLRFDGTDVLFTGDLTGATGTFSGNLAVAGSAYIQGTGSETVDGTSYTAALLVNGTYNSDKGMVAHTNTLDTGEAAVGVAHNGGFGVVGLVTGSTTGAGVKGIALGAGKIGVYALTVSGSALETSGGPSFFASGYTVTLGGQLTMTGAYNFVWNGYTIAAPAGATTTYLRNDGTWSAVSAATLSGYSAGNASGNIPISNGTVNTNLNADLLDGNHAAAFQAAGNYVVDATATSYSLYGTQTPGTGVATYDGTAKPGGSTTNAWIKVIINGTTYYIPVWT